jgi:1,2-diacylglycerol 3-alpha-glucosyltransferase
MRIGVFTNVCVPALNGVAKSIEVFRRGLSELGHEVFIIAPEIAGNNHHPGYVLACRAVRAGRNNDYPIALPGSLSHRRVDELKLDLVHCQHVVWVGRWGLRYARRRHLPVVATVHTHYDSCLPYVPVGRPVARRLLRRTYRRFCNQCHTVIAPTPARRDQLRGMGVTVPIAVVPNGLNLAEFAAPHREQWRARWNLRPDEVAVGYLGRIGPEKRCELLVRSFARLPRQPAVRLVIAGDGPSLPALERLAAAIGLRDTVTFAGAVPHEEIASCHAAFDIFALASPLETMPMSLLEAMAAGRPAVAFDVPGPRDVIVDGVTGLLAEDSEQALAATLEKLIVAPDLRERLGRAARLRAAAFDHVRASDRLLEVYRRALEGGA